MLQGRRMRKAVAAWLLFVFATETFAPAAAYALTSGPTSPEATSFEPIDTTDMVNLQTGDFTYNIPLLEVPGPEGGYPLSLSYHAGIQPNEEASWVGLGWTLNPGAINRSVNGYPDDWYNPSNISHTYWIGGVTETYTVGLSVGIANTPASVGFGLSISQDTYRGFSASGYLSFGSSLKVNSPFGAGVTLGMDAYGNPYVSGGIGVGSGEQGERDWAGSASIGFSTNFESINAGVSAGVGYSSNRTSKEHSFSGSLLGASLSTGGNKPSMSVGGLTASVQSSKEAGIQTKSSGFAADVPVFPGVIVSLGYSKVRYWTDEKVGVYTHGSIYSSNWGGDHLPTGHAYDTYSLLENPTDKNIVDYPDPTKLQGGAFLDYDLYNVTAQGLGGNMRPYLFQGEVLGQDRRNSSNEPLVTYYSPWGGNSQPKFRFEHDFSNSYRQGYPMYDDVDVNLKLVIPPFDSPEYGDNDGGLGYFFYELAGSRRISTGVKVQPSNIYGYSKNDRYKNNMIEGFSITNESGVTYHYALPAYCYDEEVYQGKIGALGDNFNRQIKGEAYAYMWYLTSITGPDYVDRDNEGTPGYGKASKEDWGYWINFEYGKWSDSYNWRNPSEGYHRDEDGEWADCSMGKREVYYLNAIRTRTHTALFEKEFRKDGKSSSDFIFSKYLNREYLYPGAFDDHSISSLKLSKIYLLNSSDADIVYPAVGGTDPSSPFDKPSGACTGCQLLQNVLDKTDLDAVGRQNIEDKAIRVIDFVYDYSLCPGTSNSYVTQISDVKYGKLTLKKLNLRGKQGASILPPTQFEYELTGDDLREQSGVSLSASSFSTDNNAFEVGDLIMKDDGIFCGAITEKQVSGSMYTYTLINSSYTGSTITANIRTTKNPRYNKDAYDAWNSYKSDIEPSLLVTNENLGRRTSLTSSKATDAWSLRKIISPIGSEMSITYEGDTYCNSIISHNASFILSDFSDFNVNTGEISFGVDGLENDLSQYLSPGDKVNFVALQPLRYQPDPFCSAPPGSSGTEGCNVSTMSSPAMIDPDFSTTSNIPSNYFYYRIIDTRNSGDCEITSIDDLNGRLNVKVRGITNTINTIFNKIEYAAGVVDYTQSSTSTIRNLAPLSGNLFFKSMKTIFGGGTRVCSIRSAYGNIHSVIDYSYVKPGSMKSSGVTSYEPYIFDNYDKDKIEEANFLPSYLAHHPSATPAIRAKKYKRSFYGSINELLAISREVPPPGVMYEYVTVTNEVKNTDEMDSRMTEGSIQYQFEVFRGNMVIRESLGTPQDGVFLGINQSARNLALKKFTGSIGNVKRIVQYDGKGRKLSETINHYLHDGLENLTGADFMAQYKGRVGSENYRYQGYLQERLSEIKQVENSANSADNGVKSTYLAREEYPCIQTGQTLINYLNGTRTSSENIGFDFYSGAVTKTVETDAFGNRFMTEIIPAYHIYPAMGLISQWSPPEKNMLTQIAATYMYRVDDENEKQGLISAHVQIWGNEGAVLDLDGNSIVQNNIDNGRVWRKQSSYEWMPVDQTSDGLTTMGNFSDFNWASPSSSPANWKKTGEITLYDVYSKGLEGMDINGNYSATRMSYGSKKVELTGSNANYYEIAYSGAEDEGADETNNVFVKKGDGTVSTAVAHTGAKSLQLGTGGKKGLVYTVATDKLLTGRPYTASVWVKPETGSASDVKLYYDINGTVKASASSSSSTKTADGWILVTLSINGVDITSGQTLTVGCQNDHGSVEAYVDDFRFQPVTASTTAYVYDSLSGELTYVLDNNNLYTAYEYDAAGRLIKTSREKLGVGKLKTTEYKYNMRQPLYVAPPTIYAKFVYVYRTTTTVGCLKSEIYDVSVKFYSDAACTTSMYVSDLLINYNKEEVDMEFDVHETNVYSHTIGSTPVEEYYLGDIALFNKGCDKPDGHAIYNLLPGEYVIKSSVPPSRPIPPLYVKMNKIYVDYETDEDNGCLRNDYYDVYVNFYSDAACTSPVSVNDITVYYWFDGHTYSFTIGYFDSPKSSIRILDSETLHIEDECWGGETFIECDLVGSTEYMIVP